mgnify:CR=1 FL=1
MNLKIRGRLIHEVDLYTSNYGKCYFCLTVKAKTAHEIVKNRPAAGVLDQALATEYKVGFLMNASPISVFTARIKASAVRRTIE